VFKDSDRLPYEEPVFCLYGGMGRCFADPNGERYGAYQDRLMLTSLETRFGLLSSTDGHA
jgi:hypothetical protein